MMARQSLECASKSLLIRPYRASDYPAWKDGYAGKRRKQNRFDVGSPPAKKLSKAIFSKLLRRHRELRKKDKIYVLGAFDRVTHALVGAVDLLIVARMEFQWAGLGYQIFNQYWGRGYGPEAARLALMLAFKSLGLNRVEAAINLDNQASIKVAKRAGMRRECIRRQFYFESGKWVDHLIYVAIPEDVGLKSLKPKIS